MQAPQLFVLHPCQQPIKSFFRAEEKPRPYLSPASLGARPNMIESYYDAGRNATFVRCSCWKHLLGSDFDTAIGAALFDGWYSANKPYPHADWCEHKKPASLRVHCATACQAVADHATK